MKAFPIFYSFIAALAMGARVKANEGDEDSNIIHISLKAVMEIQNKFSELKHDFESAKIDSRNYYCETQWNDDVVNQVTDTPGLVVEIIQFQKLCEKNGLFDAEMFCFDIWIILDTKRNNSNTRIISK